MKANSKQLLKEILPPILIKSLRKAGIFGNMHWSGDFADWSEAMKRSIGYDSDVILGKVRDALLKVKRGEAAYERDSVLYSEIEYSWPVLAGLLWVYSQDHRLNIIDFGGSLGSTYFQNRKFLSSLENVVWSIVEQKQFVDIGVKDFQDHQLKFFYDIDSCVKETQPNCILLSSVLPYVESPYHHVDLLLKHDFKYLLLDKMPFIDGDKDRLTIQKVPSSIYEASYPSWFFSEKKFKAIIQEKYQIIEEFMCPVEANLKSVFKGMILKLK
jgi:putative methyltransferase (TIGR04325 family)